MPLVAGLIVVALGAVPVLFPYEVARFQEQMDAIGSKRSLSEVEPADWKVAFTRLLGVVVATAGLLLAVSN